MNGLFARIISRVLPKDLPTQVGRWRIQDYEVPTQVSRWSIEKCDKKINARIDRSNEDHCGPCGRNDVK